MEVVFSIVALGIICWMLWLLYKARQFTHFKKFIEQDLKPKVLTHIKDSLIASRNEQFPNSDSHIEASLYYWSQYKARILQAALENEIIDKNWLIKTGNWRNCQHLFHVENDKLHHFNNKKDEE